VESSRLTQLMLKRHHDYRFDIPTTEIVAAGRNVIIGIDFSEILKYRVDRDAPLPTGEPSR
jgi:hypothetical protein